MGACCGGLNKPHKSLPEKKPVKGDAAPSAKAESELKATPLAAAPLNAAPGLDGTTRDGKADTAQLSDSDGTQHVNGTAGEQQQAVFAALTAASGSELNEQQHAQDEDLKETEATAARLVTEAMQAAILALSEQEEGGEQAGGAQPHSPGTEDEEALSEWMKEDTRNILVIDEAGPRVEGPNQGEVPSVAAALSAQAPPEHYSDEAAMDGHLEQLSSAPESAISAAGEVSVPVSGEHAEVIAEVRADVPKTSDASIVHTEIEEIVQIAEPAVVKAVHVDEVSVEIAHNEQRADDVETGNSPADVCIQHATGDLTLGSGPTIVQDEAGQPEHTSQEWPSPSVTAGHEDEGLSEGIEFPPPPAPITESAASMESPPIEEPAHLSQVVDHENSESELIDHLRHTSLTVGQVEVNANESPVIEQVGEQASPVLEQVGEQARQDRESWWAEQGGAGDAPILEDVLATARDQREQWWSSAGEPRDLPTAEVVGAATDSSTAPSHGEDVTPGKNVLEQQSLENFNLASAPPDSLAEYSVLVGEVNDAQRSESMHREGGEGCSDAGGDMTSSAGGSADSPEGRLASSPESPQRLDAHGDGVPALEAAVPLQA